MKKYLSENPKLVSEWHPTKNKDLKPEDFTLGSDKKVWWKCPEGNDHEWKAVVKNRSINGTRCPFCSGHKASKSNNLLALNPKLASEWHPTKNGDLKPENFTLGSSKKVWWQCSRDEDHEWEATIANRSKSKGSGCRFCYAIQKTKLTKRKLNEIKRLRETGLTLEKISKEVEISIATVHKVIKNM